MAALAGMRSVKELSAHGDNATVQFTWEYLPERRERSVVVGVLLVRGHGLKVVGETEAIRKPSL